MQGDEVVGREERADTVLEPGAADRADREHAVATLRHERSHVGHVVDEVRDRPAIGRAVSLEHDVRRVR